MAVTDIFSRVAAALFRAEPLGAAGAIEPSVLAAAVDSIVEAVEPRIRLVPRYQRKLGPSVLRTIGYLRTLVPSLPEPVELSQRAWRDDPAINALFARADDIDKLFARTSALRTFIADATNVGSGSAYAVLGMQREERKVFASALVDGEVRGDVAQTTVSFSEHRLVAIASDAIASRRLLGMAILERMAVLALERIEAMRERATALDMRASLLATRQRLLTLRRGGLHELAPGEKDAAQELVVIEAELAAMSKERREVKASLATLDSSIGEIAGVFGEPERHVGIDSVEMRLSHTGYKLELAAKERGTALRFSELWVGSALRAVAVPVYVSREALPARAYK